jgi:hypothetical protein
MPFGGVIVNRVHHDVLGDADPAAITGELSDRVGGELARKAAANFADYHALARRDAAGMEHLLEELGPATPLIPVPHFDDDVHDVDGLQLMRRWLFAQDTERDALLAATTA